MTFLCVFFTILLTIKTADLEDIKDLDITQLLQLAQDVSQVKIGDVKDDDVSYFLLTRAAPSPTKVSGKEDSIEISKPTKFLIHGWIATNRRPWNQKMSEEFLRNGDFNVIQVDWERPARTSYVSSVTDTKLVGNRIAQFILDAKIPADKVHLIGHSLGAHIAGFAAKKIKEETGETIARISGLDPAGPLFNEFALVKEERLDKEDAEVVEVIHTDAGAYGIGFPIGTLDIIVNGGRTPQPGCLEDFSALSLGGLIQHSYCSHEMSTTYFIEWINNGKFRCELCSSWESFLVRNCSKYVSFREGEINEKVTGICFTRTHNHAPFLHD